MNDEAKNRPIETLRDGAIEVSIWEKQTETGTAYNTQRFRSYQDQEGQWKRTHAIPERDLLRAARLDELAYGSIKKLREQDRLQEMKVEPDRRTRNRDRGR